MQCGRGKVALISQSKIDLKQHDVQWLQWPEAIGMADDVDAYRAWKMTEVKKKKRMEKQINK